MGPKMDAAARLRDPACAAACVAEVKVAAPRASASVPAPPWESSCVAMMRPPRDSGASVPPEKESTKEGFSSAPKVSSAVLTRRAW